MEEQWKFINEINLISNKGRISHLYARANKKITFGTDNNKHYSIELYGKKHYVHNLVYKCFVGEIPKGYVVHHKNHNGYDNRVENLQLMTIEEHHKYHASNKDEEWKNKLSDKLSKQIYQYDKDLNLIKIWKSATIVEKETNGFFRQGKISDCCLGKYGRKSHKGFIWSYSPLSPSN